MANMTLRLSDAETQELRAAAEREGRSMQDVARAAVRAYTSRRNLLRDELLDTIMREDAEALDRLANS